MKEIEIAIKDIFKESGGNDYVFYIKGEMDDVVIDGTFDLNILRDDIEKIVTAAEQAGEERMREKVRGMKLPDNFQGTREEVWFKRTIMLVLRALK